MAGGNGVGAATNQLNGASGLFISDDGSIYIADAWNHRVVKWAPGVSNGRVVAGYGTPGSHSDLLNNVDSFIFDDRHRLLSSPFISPADRAICE